MFEYLESLFVNLKNEKSDINEHLETLKKLASECDTVIEFGVRWMVSIIALAVSGCKNLHAYDTTDPAGFDPYRFQQLKNYCERNNINFYLNEVNVLNIKTIPQCDMLFLDTYHSYLQLKCELFLFSDKVKKYIVMHDTFSFSASDECYITRESWFDMCKDNPEILKIVDIKSEKSGLTSAIEEFLELNPEWEVFEKYTNNNGLTILKRNS
jgi:hypothetical protein